MTETMAEKAAREGYAAFRSQFRPSDLGAPAEWQQLTEREQRAFICVAQWGIDQEAARRAVVVR